MKLKMGFQIVDLGDEFLAVPVGDESVLFQGVVNLSEEAAFVLRHMGKDISVEELSKLLSEEYTIEYDSALSEIKEFMAKLVDMGMIDENDNEKS